MKIKKLDIADVENVVIKRSPLDHKAFNVVGTDKKGSVCVVFTPEIEDYEEAVSTLESVKEEIQRAD